MKRLALLFALFSSAAAFAATAPPKVVFFGDGFTASWPLPAPYINKGGAGFNLDGLESSQAAADFQSAVVSQHPAIVHILIGNSDFGDDASYQGEVPGYLAAVTTMVNEAKAANIKVILGTLVPNYGGWGLPINEFNAALFAYGAANGIQVINYHDALCQCVGSTSGSLFDNIFLDASGNPSLSTPYLMAGGDGIDTPGLIPNAAGYALMTQMAQTAIANITATPKSGYLQDVILGTADTSAGAVNQNTVSGGEKLQFTPVGQYTDGTIHPQNNSNFAGFSGTWTTSNPLVMYVSPTGQAWALTPGTAIIKYTSLSGVQFSEWIMYVSAGS
jgi:lysophospholipase L1-like esterase